MAVHGHVDRHVGLERAVFRTREVFAAQAIHFAVLPFLRFLHPGVRRGAALGHTGASDMDWSILLYLDLGVRSSGRWWSISSTPTKASGCLDSSRQAQPSVRLSGRA